MKTNTVIAGKYADTESDVVTKDGILYITFVNPEVARLKHELWVNSSMPQQEFEKTYAAYRKAKKEPCFIPINAETTLCIDSMDKDTKTSSSSAVLRGAVGALLIGGVGLLAAAGAKKKSTYTIAITWKDETKSIISIDSKFYQILLATNN